MKRLALVMTTFLAGCADFREAFFYDEPMEIMEAPASCGCQTTATGAVSASSGLVPAVTSLPSVQTREPNLAPAR